MGFDTASRYIVIDKRGDLKILFPTEEWFTYRVRDEFNLKDMPIYHKRKLCSILYKLFVIDGVLDYSFFKKKYVVDKLVEAMVIFYKDVK